MAVFTNVDEAEKYAGEKYCFKEKFKEPCVPYIYVRTLRGKVNDA
jgi:hypothetical protein